ncbi:hypothetical protein [Fluviicola chungangensis]|uniref:DUF3828 domain-containing protein n=1 Tax=Fluviicola chungangensis TaxID=2597671 RepID=A0A556N6Z6_9FLAO|nr:hypothetical protein [Fluviicola chungangensis]TSJ47925.1 hypothetical protein FO442_01990 [Fluviicola chungangensis]
MKKALVLFLATTIFSCDTSNGTGAEKTGPDPRVALDVLNEYTAACKALKDPGKWVENQDQLTVDFKKEYQKIMKQAWEDDPEMGLGFDPIFDAQDYSEKGYEINFFDSKTGLVILQGVDSPGFKVSLRLKMVGNRCLVDGAGVIRM